MADLIHPVILCGGAGTRLWPLSTPQHPKQFLALTSDKSMIAETADRFSRSRVAGLEFAQAVVVGSLKHHSLLQQAVPSARLILEPFGRNSAPAIAAACLVMDPDDLLLILSADHSIKDVDAFQRAIATGAKAAQDGAMVTFGIQPSFPATGYGYIKAQPPAGADILKVEAFVEKPPLAAAQSYLDDGNYYWNAGIFLFQAGVMLAALEAHAVDILPPVRAALGQNRDDPIKLAADAFKQAPDISIDYAIMERAENVQVVPLEMGWSDVGDYQALLDLFSETEGQSVSVGPTVQVETKGVYAKSTGPVLAVSGVSDLIIVATGDTVMVAPMGAHKSVKTLGKLVQGHRDRIGVSSDTIDQARTWLWTAFDVWGQRAWDGERGGFVEQLDLDGVADTVAHRRVRVQARQVYSFARSIELGWPNRSVAEYLVTKGVEYLDTQLRHREGGWIHVADENGQIVDEERDLYDHAFIILAGAAAYKATGNETALKLAHDAINFIEAELKDPQYGGWLENLSGASPRRANPHMHMLEAMLALHAATGEARALKIATDVVQLFEARFFRPECDLLGETFKSDWTHLQASEEAVFEPGHHYEWANLLAYYERLTGHDTISWRRRLIRRADESGLDAASGFALNTARLSGDPADDGRRLWPQLEMFRAHLLHPGVSASGSNDSRFRAIMDKYLTWGPDGGWLDETDRSGEASVSAIPASILYHLITAFSALIEP